MNSNCEWPEVLLDDVALEITVGHVGPMASEYVTSGIPFLRSQNVEPFRINLQDIKFITQEFHERLHKSALSPGDVVIVRTGKPGASAVIPETLPISNCSDLVVVHPGPNLDSKFLAYYINSISSGDVSAQLVGAVQQHFNVGSARNLKICLPPLPEQRAIACILGSLDDKIEANRRMNETLEAMARAIFKSWFVDFDPVRAKAEGRAPAGMDAETAALFPDSFEETELGMVPRGWEMGTLGEDFDLTMGQSPPGDTYNEIGEGMAFYQGRADFGFRYPSVRMYCTAPTRKANPGDTLVSVRAPVGDVNMALKRCCIGRGLSAIRHKSGSRSFTYYSMLSLRDIFIQFEAEGTVFGSISKKDFEEIPCVIPQAKVVQKYEEITHPLDQLIENNENESRILASMRDSLLPKLISGKIRLDNAEQFLKNQGL